MINKKIKNNNKRILFYSGLALIFICVYILHVYFVSKSCAIDVRRISFVGGQEYAEITDKFCDNFGGSDVVTLSLHVNGNDSPVFVFDSGFESKPLEVKWLDRNNLNVSVDRVAIIQKKVTNVNGININYHIGAIGEVIVR